MKHNGQVSICRNSPISWFYWNESACACGVCESQLPYWFVLWNNIVDPTVPLDNLISLLPFHTIISSLGSPSLYSAGLHHSHRLSTLRPSRTKREKLQCLWRMESHLGGWQRNKTVRERWRETERMSGNEGGRLAGKERREGRHRNWHRDILWLITGQRCMAAEAH